MSLGIDEMIQNYLSRLEPEYIDSFRQLVAASIDAEFQKVEARYENQSAREYESPELRCLHCSMIEDDGVYVGYIQELAHELSIVALYKIFEKKNKELITHHRKEEESKKYSTWDNVLKVLPAKAKELSSFLAVDELRVLNNAIKHEGVVSKELSKRFPVYGEAGDDFNGLSEAYERLKPGVVEYISELHHIYENEKSYCQIWCSRVL